MSEDGNEIECPHCKKIIPIDQSGYANILQQVRDVEFESQLKQRVLLEKESLEKDIELAKKDVEKENSKVLGDKELEIGRLKEKLKSAETTKELAIRDAVDPMKKEIDNLKHQIDSTEDKKELAIRDAVDPMKKRISSLESTIESQKEAHLNQIKDRDDAIDRLKDFKAKLSTKMLGETLEIHCENEFNSIRATAFPNAYFEKDNEVIGGSKGDYIFREEDNNGTEFISIMFEMKNESDTTEKKKTNEAFLEKLDKDRNNKGCEFAILVSVLESDNDLYNNGIVDKSHRYPNMYVIRPQFFIPMITLLRNAATKSIKVRNELALFKEQNIDITKFEDNLNDFKETFAKRYGLASDRFEDAIKQIDKSIKALQDTKANLLKSDDHLRIANNKAQDVTIKKLTKNNPTMKEKFDEIADSNDDDDDEAAAVATLPPK